MRKKQKCFAGLSPVVSIDFLFPSYLPLAQENGNGKATMNLPDGVHKPKIMSNIKFQTIDWDLLEQTKHKGETGLASIKTLQLEGIRLRIVEYSEEYLADHWCKKGHIVYCIEGEFTSQLQNGEHFTLKKE